MSTSPSEHVLGLSADWFERTGFFRGFRPYDPAFLTRLLDSTQLQFRPRDQAEVDPSFKQLIPYVVLRHGGKLFHYTRGQSGTESRLRAKRSIGIGGHISADDDSTAPDPYRAGMERELAEEVDVQSPYHESILGLIYDDSTPVGCVHLGVVHLLELEQPLVIPRESGIAAAGFAPLVDLLRSRDDFESWSRLVLEHLVKQQGGPP